MGLASSFIGSVLGDHGGECESLHGETQPQGGGQEDSDENPFYLPDPSDTPLLTRSCLLGLTYLGPSIQTSIWGYFYSNHHSQELHGIGNLKGETVFLTLYVCRVIFFNS